MKKKVFAAISALAVCLMPMTAYAGNVILIDPDTPEIDLTDYITDCTALRKAKPVMFSEYQALVSFQLPVMVEGCVITPNTMEWEVSGTADVTYETDSFFDSVSYDENYANSYCLITANSPGTVYVKGTEYSLHDSDGTEFYFNLTVGEDGNFEETVTYDEPVEASFLDWIPKNFSEAMEFHNTYGKNHVEDGLICCVRKEQLDKDDYAIDASTSTAEYELLSQKVYEYTASDETDYADYAAVDFKYEVYVYQPTSAGTLSLDWAAGFGISNEYAVMHFDIAEDGTITQTDLCGWLPDCYKEYKAFEKGITIQNGYIVYCDFVQTSAGYDLYVDQLGTGRVEQIMDYTVCDDSIMPPPPGTGSYVIRVYTPVTSGTLKMTFTQERSWEDDGALSTIIKFYEIGNDGSIREIEDTEVITPLQGDCNLDGKFSVVDVVMLQKWLFGSGEISCWQNADYCPDGKLNGFDLAFMKRELLKKTQNAAEPMLMIMDHQITLDENGWGSRTLAKLMDTDGSVHTNKTEAAVSNFDVNTYLDHADTIIADVASSSKLNQSDIPVIEEFSQNAARYRDCEMTEWGFAVSDYGQENLYAVYPDGNGGYRALELCRFGDECAWLDDDEVQEFVTMLIANGYYADSTALEYFSECSSE